MNLSQRTVAELLGFSDTTMLSRYEHGRALPSLTAALRLEIIYRMPVAFLFPVLYDHLREDIRAREAEAMRKAPRQQCLF